MQCELCGREGVSGERVHQYALDVCMQCEVEPTRAIGGWRASVRSRQWRVHGANHRRSRQSWVHSEVVGSTPVALPQAVFSREHIGHKVLKLFADELEAGDPIFDDHVFVDTKERDATAALLASETAQSALLQLVAGDFTVNLEGTAIRSLRIGRDEVDLQDVEFATVAFLRAVTRLEF